MSHPVLIVPGIGNSGPDHWQSRWQAAHPDWHRLQVADWNNVLCDDWVAALDSQLAMLGSNTLIVAHSLGCLTVAHWGALHMLPVRGALLVAVPDPAAAAFPATAARGFSPLPSRALPFPSIVVASSNDPYGSVSHAAACAAAWGSEFVDAGAHGHLNADSALGDWPQGYSLLEKLAR